MAQAQGGPTNKTFNFPAMASEGELLNVEASADGLVLVTELKTLPFIWIAASGRGTVVKVDTATGEVLGEFRTAPQGMQVNPSRTTVDLNGNAWVGNRNEKGDGKGSVAHLGLKENNQCVDRNGNGVIDTSTGLGDIKAWTNANWVDKNGGVSTAADECIIHYVRTNGVGIRHVSIDENNDVWVGGHQDYKFDRINGETGQITRSRTFKCGGYGGLIDGNGVLWSTRYSWDQVLRYDTKADTVQCIKDSKFSKTYGMGIDSDGNVWMSRISGGVVKVNADASEIEVFSSPRGRGVAGSSDGHVWVALDTSNQVIKFQNDGTEVGRYSVTNFPVGIAIDAAGKVWTANQKSNNASRINPGSGAVEKAVSLGAGASPYNYSDMTGAVAFANTSPQGSWTTVIDGGLRETTWNSVGWEYTHSNKGEVVEITVRTANTEAGLGGANPVIMTESGNMNLPKGRFLQLQVKLMPGTDKSSPVVTKVEVSYTNSNTSADDAPALTATGNKTWAVGGNAVVVDPNATVTGDSTINGARVSIGDNFKAAEDRLGIEGKSGSSGTINGIKWSYDTAKGIMTFSGATSTANYQAALRQVTYYNISNSPDETARKVDFTLGSAIAYPGNSHFYEFIASSNSITWQEAKEEAEGRRLYGLQGYLVTATSAGENNFVLTKTGGSFAWTGGSDEAAEGTWKWVTGPETGTTFWQGANNGTAVGYANWNSANPSNSGSGEDSMHLLADGKWNDWPDNYSQVKGYVVEYGGMAGDPTLKLTGQVTVNISVNKPPTDITLDKNTVPENTEAGFRVGTLKGVDPDDTIHDYTLAEGPGNRDNGSFELKCDVAVMLDRAKGNQCALHTKAKFDFETQPKLLILVQVEDNSGNKYDKKFTIDVTNVDEPPVVKVLPPVVVDEDDDPTVIEVDAKDPEEDSLTCEATSSNTDLVTVTIDENCKLTLTYKPNQSGKSTITVKVTANGKVTEREFEVTVNDIQDPIQITKEKAKQIGELLSGLLEDDTVDAINADGLFTDIEGGTIVYSAASDNETVLTAAIDGKTLNVTIKADQYGDVKITVTGTVGERKAEVIYDLTVTPVNDKPSFATLGNQKMAEWGVEAQTVSGFAKDFNPGPNEADQAVDDYIVTVMGDGAELFETQPDVANDGTLTYKPSGAAGVATVKLVVRDNGGTDNGGINESESQIFTIEIPRADRDLVVKNLNDDGPDSLRYVLRYIGIGRTVTFDPSLEDGTIGLETQLCIYNNVTINAEALNISLSGQSKHRVLCIYALDVTIKGVNIVDGYTPKEAIDDFYVGGGGIFVYEENAKVALENCTVANNSSDYTGGGIEGIGTMTIDNCVIENNTAKHHGGGIWFIEGNLTIRDSQVNENESGNRGGGVSTSNVVLRIIDSEVNGNKAVTGGGFYSDEFENGSFEVTRSTLARNEASSWGGAFLGDFGKVYNSTISENEAGGAGGFADASAVGQTDARRLIEVYGSTIYGNRATLHTNSGGISSYYAKIELTNCILAGNTRSGEAGSVETKNYINENRGELVSKGWNISDDDLSGTAGTTGDKFKLNLMTEVKLAPLGYYGAETESRPPLAGSEAVDNGDNTTCTNKQGSKDQMSNDRPKQGNPDGAGACDIGAIEIQGAWPKVSQVTPNETSLVQSGDPINITFSEPVTVAEGGMEVICPVGGQPLAVTRTGSDANYTLTPAAGLPNGVVCEVVVYADKVTDKDSTIPGTGNLGEDYSSRFSTIPEVRVEVNYTEGIETLQTKFTIYAIASGPVSGDQTVDVTVTGIDGTDYTLDKTSIKILDGSTRGLATLTIVDDAVDEDQETATITISGPTSNIVLDTTDSATIEVNDNDDAGINAPSSVGVTEGVTDTFVLKLTSEPTADVIVTFSKTDAVTGSRYHAPADVTLNRDNWNTGVPVTVKTINNGTQDGNWDSELSLALTSTDDKYSDMAGKITVNIKDDDKANVVLSRSSFKLDEGENDTFLVKLTTDPTANVTVAFTSTNARCTVSASPVTGILNAANRTTGITATVIAVANQIDDGDTSCPIQVGATSTDGDYNNISDDVTVAVSDDDDAGIEVTTTGDLVTTEKGVTEIFNIVLTSEPTDTVTISLSTDDPTEGTVTSQVTFDATNWDTAQTVNVTGVDDDETDGNIDYTVIISPATGGGYDGLKAGGDAESHKPGTGVEVIVVWVNNEDDDTIGFSLSKTDGLNTSEAGEKDSFTMQLNTKPFAPVIVNVTSSNLGEGTASPSQLVFSSTNWSVAQTIEVIGVDDYFMDGTVPYTLTVSVDSETEDAEYKEVVRTVGAENADNDVPGITVAPTTLVVDEQGMTKTFSVVLDSRPSSNVEITMYPDDSKAGSVSPTSFAFTADDWDTPQVAVVTGLHDPARTTDVAFKIVNKIGLDVFDKDYAAIDPTDVDVTSSNVNRPIAVGDTGLTSENVEVTITVLSNDTDLTETGSDGASYLTVDAIAGAPEFGTVEIVDGTKIKYMPGLDYAGTDTFTYTVKDSDGFTSEGVVSVDVFPLVASTNAPVFGTPDDGSSQLITPADGSSVGTQPVFTWVPATSGVGVDYYEIMLDPMPTGVTGPLTTDTPRYEPPFELPEGEYSWTVKAYDSEDNASSPIMPQSRFTVKLGLPSIYLPIITK
ncbi:Ig-like domain-containing protein [Anaerolineales bacterium HSG24]|nr:Ig-like domain-containing protein [Anaerolineales bacterium HSG24]